jgi:anthranilate phosphoribosyltransferase
MSTEELKVSSPQESARKIRDLFEGRLEGACLNSLLMNAAAAFMALNGAVGIKDGMALARKVISSGQALSALERARA